ncbi:unnamed protein product [Closterium sp. NIES-54]
MGWQERREMEVDAYLRRKYEGLITGIEPVEKEDLDLPNHLSGRRRVYLKVCFANVQNLMEVRRDVLAVVERNKTRAQAAGAYGSFEGINLSLLTGATGMSGAGSGTGSGYGQQYLHATSESHKAVHAGLQQEGAESLMVDIREYDVPYHMRFAIDKNVRCGWWFTVAIDAGNITLTHRPDLIRSPEPRVCAFDIETTKLPLKFPDASFDIIFMLSYMIDGKGYLLVNREVVGEDIKDLEYTPKPEFQGPFHVTNVENEEQLLKRWFAHMRAERPGIYVTYNGDFFDWPFIEQRAATHGMSLLQEMGFKCDAVSGECRSRFVCHLDAFAWVRRDSYLPQGSQGLKAVTRAKLGYDPHEVDAEDMVRFAREQPQVMASYSVSDALATYFLYKTYVHPFIFSLATIIPMPPDEVLRKGSGTLCETLLMVEAYRSNIVCPNKHVDAVERFHGNRLLESETYIGGHVECLESGVFRSDIPTKFRLHPPAYQMLMDKLDEDLVYALKEEGGMAVEDVSNYEHVKQSIVDKLSALRDAPVREECPVIYHLDVAAMYPNIMLTNRLQPPSIVTEEVCAACDFNRPGKNCLRPLEWVWRGETYTASKSEYYQLRSQMETERFPCAAHGGQVRSFRELPLQEQQDRVKERLKKYCQKVYKRVVDKPKVEVKVAGVCQRENSFYIDTVRSFRDRRYEYKGLNKKWKGKLGDAKKSGNAFAIQEAQDMVVVYDSLQLAHKCILNSFYGYVMRKGARWYSMEMAGITTYTGAKLIQSARELVERVGKPLELDTDGIWCCLPASFPQDFCFTPSKPGGKKLTISYPCVMLNADVKKHNTNDQYQTLVDPESRRYEVASECSIAFEVDGPYKAMILPASKEEGVLLKKRYAVFNLDGSLAELKGFELKRRGELKLIKVFQSEVFECFLAGTSLPECYAAVAAVANNWLDMLDSCGAGLEEAELLEHISESCTMSKALEEYGGRKSTAATTAIRLADFLGEAMIKDKGLSCKYIVAKYPATSPVSERAIPVAIFNAEPEVMRVYLRKWCKEAHGPLDVRGIVDWDYYRQRLSSAIQKIITIPAAMQKVKNPVPRVAHPDWLSRRVRQQEDRWQQRSLRGFFSASLAPAAADAAAAAADGADADAAAAAAATDADAGGGGDANANASTGQDPGREGANGAPVDLEDIGGRGGRGREGGTRAVVRRQVQARLVVPEREGGREREEEERDRRGREARERSPDPGEDYGKWLQHKKRKWRRALEERKRRRQGEGEGGGGEGMGGGAAGTRRRLGVSGLLRHADDALTRSHWQVGRGRRRRYGLAGCSGSVGWWGSGAVRRLGRALAGPGTSVGAGGSDWLLRACLQCGTEEGAYHICIAISMFHIPSPPFCLHLPPLNLPTPLLQLLPSPTPLHTPVIQIIQVTPTATPGEFSLWVVVGAAGVRRVVVRVPRVFYLNTRAAVKQEEAPGELVSRTLPHGHPLLNLLKVCCHAIGPTVVGGRGDCWYHGSCTALDQLLIRPYLSPSCLPVLLPPCPSASSSPFNLHPPLLFFPSPSARRPTLPTGPPFRVPVAHPSPAADGAGEPGVYEAQVPLLTHLLLSLGTVCSVDSRARSKATATTKTTNTTSAGSSGGAWDMGHLSMRTTTECPYLPSTLSSCSFLYLYHSGTDTRAVYALFMPSLPALLLLFVSPVPTRDVTPAHLHRHFVAAATAAHATNPDVPAPPTAASVPVKVEYVGARQDACKAVQRAIEELRGSHHGPLIALVEDSTRTAGTLPGSGGTSTTTTGAGAGAGGTGGGGASGGLGGVAALESMPCVEVPGNAGDNRFPALGWQAAAGRVAVHRCAQASVWLHQRIALARYAHIPIGNMSKDWILHTADVFFARALRDNNHLLWLSHTGVPDVGGVAEEEAMSFLDEVQQPQVVVPGHYTTITVELKIQHLAVCALIKSTIINDIEGGALLGASHPHSHPHSSSQPHASSHPRFLFQTQATTTPATGSNPSDHRTTEAASASAAAAAEAVREAEAELEGVLGGVQGDEAERGGAGASGGHVMEDEAAMCRSAFKVLRGMVTAWVTDVVRTRSLYADALLQHLYRWICSPSSTLHDPFLHRLLHKIMCKLFALLLAELRRLGATVIYADFSRVILATGRRSLPSAMAYVDYLVAAVNSRDAFELLHVEKQRVWHSLLFLDKFNFGGIVDSTQLEQQQPEGEGENGEAARHANGNGSATADANGGGGDGGGDGAGSGVGAGAGKQVDGRGGEEGKMTVLSQWNIADYLPSSVQEYFHLTVSDFIFNPWVAARDRCTERTLQRRAAAALAARAREREREKEREKGKAGKAGKEGGGGDVGEEAEEGRVDEEDEEAELARNEVQNRLTDNLLHLVRALQAEAERGGEDAEEEGEGGEECRVGKSGKGGQRGRGRGALGATGGRALELVKAVCHVLSLSAHVQHEVQVLRRQLLRVLRVREFAPEAIFRDPCRSFVLPGVICSYCNDCRDLDLCRDQLLQAGEWRCAVPHCQHPYDLLWIENALLEVMRHRVRSYQLQDLVCNKCRQVKSARAALHCTCAGTFRCSQQAEQLREGLLVLHSVASTHGFPLLLECLQWLLPLCRATGEK